ncbi:PAS domain S-box protein [Alkalihalophilus sp. As8PL]|uniref:histidine kinase n=1 Tax=Alkalihalophilus sp. As8PL TaxID=3237103 RepID=A0AB39BRB0_9BACI
MSVVLQGKWNLTVFKEMVLDSSSPTVLCCWRESNQELELICVNDVTKECLLKQKLTINDLKELIYAFAPTNFYDKAEWSGQFTFPNGYCTMEANLLFRSKGERYYLLYLKEDPTLITEPALSLHDVFNQNDDAIFLLDQDGYFVDMNIKAEELSGLKGDAFKGVHYEQLLLSEERMSVANHFEKAFAGEVQVYDVGFRSQKGSLSLSIINIPHIVDGEIKGVYGVAKQKEIPCDFDELALVIQDKYKIIVEHSYDIICLTDKEGHYLLASNSYLPVLGYEPCSLIGQSVLVYIHPSDHKRVFETFEEMVRTKLPSEAVIYRKLHANGYYQYLEGKGMPIISSDGEVVSFVFISRDITDIKKREDLLRRSEKLALAGELAAGIAHEIRNPLTTLRGFFQLTESQLEPYREVLMGELNQINDIIEELLLVARPRAISEERVDIAQLVESCVRDISTELHLKNIQLEIQVVHEAYVNCVPHQLKQVFINLFKNAIDAMSNEGKLMIILNRVNDTIHISIKDNGKGMDEEELAKLGEPYYSTTIKGTGIGLMVCYKVIENHRGDLSIHSVQNEGTEVSIQLPIVK